MVGRFSWLMSSHRLLRSLPGDANTPGPVFTGLDEVDFPRRLNGLLLRPRQHRYVHPKVLYGYFPCQSSGNELIVYDPLGMQEPGGPLRAIARFHFPRQHERERLCLADYFAPVNGGEIDVVAFQVVTMGESVSEAVHQLQQAGDYAEAYFVHGLAVEMAEGLAEYTNRLIRQELGLDEQRGRRYSWGYPAIPDLEDHVKVFQLLPVAATIGVDLTEAFQLVPEQSTAAILVHHQQATYFAVREQAAAAV